MNDWNDNWSKADSEAMAAALSDFNGYAARLALAKNMDYADRESEFINSWYRLQDAMVAFLRNQGGRTPPPYEPLAPRFA
jgi:hypothetical protein